MVRQLGGPESLNLEEVAPGEPADGLVRIRVRAAAINFPDALMVAGLYQVKPELPFVPGVEVSGEVLSAPPASGFKTGDRVMALLDSARADIAREEDNPYAVGWRNLAYRHIDAAKEHLRRAAVTLRLDRELGF